MHHNFLWNVHGVHLFIIISSIWSKKISKAPSFFAVKTAYGHKSWLFVEWSELLLIQSSRIERCRFRREKVLMGHPCYVMAQERELKEFERVFSSTLLSLHLLLDPDLGLEHLSEEIADIYLAQRKGVAILNFCIIPEIVRCGKLLDVWYRPSSPFPRTSSLLHIVQNRYCVL